MKKTIAVIALIALWLFAMWVPGRVSAGGMGPSPYHDVYTLVSGTTTTSDTSSTYTFDGPVAVFGCTLTTASSHSNFTVRVDTTPIASGGWDTVTPVFSMATGSPPVTVVTRSTTTMLVRSIRSVVTGNTDTSVSATLKCAGR